MTYQYLDAQTPIAFAHRGGNLAAPENTIAAFRHAVELGYDYLETDVHRTKDGVLVAFHDSGLERVSGLTGTIAEQTWSDLQRVSLEGGHGIPTLDELLETFPEARFNIDPKADDSVVLLADAIVAHGAINRVGIGSFSDDRISQLQQRLGDTLCTSPGPRGALRVVAETYLGRDTPLQYGCMQLPVGYKGLRLTAGVVKRLQRRGLQVHVWTLNTEAEMHRILDMGVDGVMTDDTALLKDVLVNRGQWHGSH